MYVSLTLGFSVALVVSGILRKPFKDNIEVDYIWQPVRNNSG